jgi:fused signal recognition particle receptor
MSEAQAPTPTAAPAPEMTSEEQEGSKKKKKGWLSRLFGGSSEETLPLTDTPNTDETPFLSEAPVLEDSASGPAVDTPAVESPALSEVPDVSPVPELVSEGELKTETAPEEPTKPPQPDSEIPSEPPLSEEPVSEQPVTPESKTEKKSWFQRLKDGLSRSSSKLTTGITDLFTKRKLDDEAVEELEDLLIQADLGVKTAGTLTKALAKGRFGKDITAEEVRAALAEEATRLLEPVARPLEIDRNRKPHVILVVGVNGAGKTTTIGKMAKQFSEQGLSVSLAAGDTFRAAAVEQLKVWGDRTGCPVISRDTGADAAGLAYDALKDATARGDDLLLIDTAGRLHNKGALMEELQKIRRVLQKLDPSAPHTTLLVLDATVGQNAHQQVKVFGEMVDVTGLVMTKLDGTAKGGVVVALAQEFALPVHYVGVGETVDDLRAFNAADFARSLMGL